MSFLPLRRILRPAAAFAAAASFAFILAACAQKPPEDQLDEAMQLVQEGQVARGILKLKELVQKHPDDPAALTAHAHLGNYYFGERNAPKALEEFAAVLEKLNYEDPRGRLAVDGIVAIRAGSGDFDGALQLMDEQIALLPDPASDVAVELGLRKADVLLASGSDEHTSAGVALLRTMMLETPKPPRDVARERLANYYRGEKQDFAASNQVYADYLAAYPEDNLRTLLELAMSVNHRLAGEEEEAVKVFEPAAAKLLAEADAELDKAERTEKLLALAEFNSKMGRYAEAEKLMLRVMGENTRSMTAIETQFRIARMYILEAGDIPKAREVLEQIKRENPGSNISASADEWLARLDQQEKAEAEAAAGPDEQAPADAPAPAGDAAAPAGDAGQ